MDKAQFVYLMGMLWFILSLIYVNGVYARKVEDETEGFISGTFYYAILVIACFHILYAVYLGIIV